VQYPQCSKRYKGTIAHVLESICSFMLDVQEDHLLVSSSSSSPYDTNETNNNNNNNNSNCESAPTTPTSELQQQY